MPKFAASSLGVLVLAVAAFGLPVFTGLIVRSWAATHRVAVRWGRLWGVCAAAALVGAAGGYAYAVYVGSSLMPWANSAATATFLFAFVQFLAPLPLFGFSRLSRWVLRPVTMRVDLESAEPPA